MRDTEELVNVRLNARVDESVQTRIIRAGTNIKDYVFRKKIREIN